ncbi:MAG TPA: deoxyribose-phosphate aldolase [Defluviitaleaceae bacterium]|jgi:deoxyribose-phosphate aldolase|nr:deoxyribose-phosphate aldolase [Candidatus Epulonipiscium sp.]HOQ16796.1 deoxyribose-phosphate aldolase [Defluviitaleaceae bacterium]HPT76349.1 deoxyribose-phosphate aldolase [Defluviitaleaceae bacterium]HQD49868.1 deoxyribose-phosphate aldolase [Defluviitaleaceae bacterium]
MIDRELAAKIDHTLLRSEAKEEDIRKLCEEAKKYGFATVCVNPCYVTMAKHLLQGTEIGITTVIGFPLGATTSTMKAAETREAIENGATEVDMVINIGALKDKKYEYVLNDIKAVVHAADKKAVVKVIIETGLLTDEEKEKACLLAKEAGADFVKTSTGFLAGGAIKDDIILMRRTVEDTMGVKASGGIKTKGDAEALIKAGANRIGTSASVAIVDNNI